MEDRDITIESRKIKVSKCSLSKNLSRETTESDSETELEELSDCE